MQRIQTYITIAALAAPILLAACSSKASAQESNMATSPETETSAAPGCPGHDPALPASPSQEELARDIRTIVTGVKSPAQQEALAQAARLAPGHMNDALREVLIDAAAFIAYVPDPEEPPDARLDSLSRLLVCALQPHFSQEELTADILSISDEQAHYLPGNRSRQITAAWLAMHILAGEMGKTLEMAVVKGMLGIGSDSYSMHGTWNFLSEALLKQSTEYSDADLAAKIRTIQKENQDIYTPLTAIYIMEPWHPGFGDLSNIENVGPESRAAMIETLIYLNEKENELAWLLEQCIAVGDKDGAKNLEMNHQYQDHIRVFHRILAQAVASLKMPEAIEALANTGDIHIDITYIGNRSVIPIINVLSGERLYTGQVISRLSSLTDIVRASTYDREDIEPLSPENRDLIVRTAHRFLDKEYLNSLKGPNIRSVLSLATDLALSLDEPDLIQILETLRSSSEEILARGVPSSEVEYVQEDIKQKLHYHAQRDDFLDFLDEPELTQDELIAAIQDIVHGKEEEKENQLDALWQVARMEPDQIGDSLRTVLTEAFLYKYEAVMQQKNAGINIYAETGDYDAIMHTMEDAIAQLRDPSFIQLFIHMDQYGICGDGPDEIFRQFPDTSVALLAETISKPQTTLNKMSDGLALLSELAASHKMGHLHFSDESRTLLTAMARHFLEGAFLSSLPSTQEPGPYGVYSYSRSDVLNGAMALAVALEDPGLIELLESLATDRDKVIALGIPKEEATSVQEDAERILNRRPYTGISDC